jgi:beta-xylosidase
MTKSGSDNAVYLADPTIFEDKGTYYLYGTTGDPVMGKDKGFLVYTSKDLLAWEGPVGATNGLALKKGDAFGDTGFWAPQVFEYQRNYYMAYTANEHIAMAVSGSPLGPFTNKTREDLKAPVKQIDPFVFFDDDGKKYLYHVRLTNGNRIFVAELNDDLLSIKPETLKECISGELPWENTQNSDWPVTEGPTVLKHRGLYYMLYSANDFRNPDYAVGYATSKSPMGPWDKSAQSPIIHKGNLGINGTGHGDVFTDISGSMHYIMHTHLNDSVVQPRRTALVKMEFMEDGDTFDKLTIVSASFQFIKQ